MSHEVAPTTPPPLAASLGSLHPGPSSEHPASSRQGSPSIAACTQQRPYGYLEDLAKSMNLAGRDYSQKPDYPLRIHLPEVSTNVLSEHFQNLPPVRPNWPGSRVDDKVGVEWRLGLDYRDCLLPEDRAPLPDTLLVEPEAPNALYRSQAPWPDFWGLEDPDPTPSGCCHVDAVTEEENKDGPSLHCLRHQPFEAASTIEVQRQGDHDDLELGGELLLQSFGRSEQPRTRRALDVEAGAEQSSLHSEVTQCAGTIPQPDF